MRLEGGGDLGGTRGNERDIKTEGTKDGKTYQDQLRFRAKAWP